MTRLLEEALAELQKLPESEQNAMASLILDELADELHWQEQFASSQAKLTQLAERARQEIRSGKVRDVGNDQL